MFSADFRELCAWDVHAKELLWSVRLPDWNLIRLGLSSDESIMTAVHTINSEVAILQLKLPPLSLAPPVQIQAKSILQRSRWEQELVAAVLADPDNDKPRLAYAQWLDEREDPRGELIRVQCQWSELDSIQKLTDQQKGQKDQLAQRQSELLERHFDNWMAALRDLQLRPAQAVFQRGFLQKLDLCAIDITDESLKLLRHVPELECLELQGSAVTDQGMSHLKKVTNLRKLDVAETAVTVSSCVQLKSLKHLIRVSNYDWGNSPIAELESLKAARNRRFLKLPEDVQRQKAVAALRVIVGWLPDDGEGHFPRISYSQSWASDGDLVYLQAFPEVEELDFFECRAVTSAGMKFLRPLKQLRRLRLGESGVTSLKPLRELQSLEELTLDSLEGLDRDSFRHLSALKNLRKLEIRFCGLNDEVLPHIAKCTQLKELYAIYNDFSKAGMAHLENLKQLEVLDVDAPADLPASLAKIPSDPPKKSTG